MLSIASGCLPPPVVFARRAIRGEERIGEAGRIDRFGSRAKERALEAMLLLASANEFTRDCGPKENEELREWRGLELEGEEKPPTPDCAA